MPEPASPLLLEPTNRLLGWSTNDFSLYGALPTVTIGLAQPAGAANGFVSVPLTPAAPVEGSTPAAEAPVPIAAVPAAPLAAEPSAPSAFAAPQPALPAAPVAGSQPISPAVPDPVGSGSLAPIAVDTPLAAADASEAAPAPITGGLGAASLAAPVLALPETALAVPAGLAGAVLAPIFVAPVLETAAAAAGGTLDLVADTAFAAPAAIPALADGLVPSGPVGTVTATVAEVAAPIAATATELIAPVTDTVAEIAGPATQTAAAVVAPIAETVVEVAPPVVDTVAAIAPVAPAAQALTAPIEPLDDAFGGTDPAAGVSTLMEMVDSADSFAPAAAEVAPITTGGSILDALADDDAPPALLGDAAETTTGPIDPDEGGVLGL